ncbi:MAG: hypothetical protein JG781_371 [Peptococcaceae bacterium]|nr:hypothetical protein [Peptococcaceae bacterium]
MAHTESDHNIEIYSGMIEEFGLADGITHGFKLAGAYFIFFRNAQERLCCPAVLAHYGDNFKTVGTQNFRQNPGFLFKPNTKGNTKFMVVHGLREMDDFLYPRPLAIALAFREGGLTGEK